MVDAALSLELVPEIDRALLLKQVEEAKKLVKGIEINIGASEKGSSKAPPKTGGGGGGIF